jgi:hypothetical protein
MKRPIERLALLISSAFVLNAAPVYAPAHAQGGRLQRPIPLPLPPGMVRKVLPGVGELNTSGVQSLTLNPDAVYAGQSSTITVALVTVAPAAGAKVLLSAAPANLATMPASVAVPAGQTTATFTVATQAGGGDATLAISVGLQGTTGRLSASLRVVGAPTSSAVDSVIAPTTVQAWRPGTGTVFLSKAAEGTGATVALSSSNPSVLTVPASVVVPAGQKSATFALTGASFGASGAVTVTASLNAVTKVASTRVMSGNDLTGFSGFRTTLKAGTSVTGTVSIAGVAPARGATVPLSVKNNSDAVVPAAVTILAGQSSGPLTITAKQGTGVILIYKTASDMLSYKGYCNGQNDPCISIQTVLVPTLSALQFQICTQNTSTCYANALTVEGGVGATLTVGISSPYPDLVPVVLSSSNPQVVPLTETLPFGNNYWYGSAPVPTRSVTAPTNVTLTAACASCQGPSQTIVLQVIPGVTVSALTVAKTDIKGGTATTGTVMLSKAAGAAGMKVDLTSSNPSICGVPASVTVPAGQTSATFAVMTQAVLSNASVTLGGSLGGGAAKTTAVRVVP